jgi:hypothetical protein
MPQNAPEATIDEDQLDARLSDLLHQMSQHYLNAQEAPAISRTAM